MNFLKSKVFKNDETSITWGKALMYAGICLAGVAVVTVIMMKILG